MIAQHALIKKEINEAVGVGSAAKKSSQTSKLQFQISNLKKVRTMKANYKIEAGDVRVIRPLCYARESLTKDFARANRLPVVNENCPACFEEPKERHRVKKVGAVCTVQLMPALKNLVLVEDLRV